MHVYKTFYRIITIPILIHSLHMQAFTRKSSARHARETNEQTNEIDSIQSIKFVPGSKINDREIIYKTIIITLTCVHRKFLQIFVLIHVRKKGRQFIVLCCVVMSSKTIIFNFSVPSLPNTIRCNFIFSSRCC